MGHEHSVIYILQNKISVRSELVVVMTTKVTLF